jgi:hypothetical protein
MRDDDKGILLCGICCIALGMLLGAMCQDKYEEGQAVKHGAARYNPMTGRFEWLDEIDKK